MTRRPSGADHGEVVPRKAWFVTLGVLGTGSLLYVFVVRGFMSPDPDPGAGLGWPLVGVLPMYALGMWLLTATSSRVALYVALGATGAMVGSAFETLSTPTRPFSGRRGTRSSTPSASRPTPWRRSA